MVVEKNGDRKKIIFNHSKPTNLIKNLSFNNEFNNHNISKTLNCLVFFKRKIDEFKVSDYRCIATEACRVVINPEFFIKKVRESSGLNVDIISSEEEARLCLKSCRMYKKKIRQCGVLFDIGGGSTEILPIYLFYYIHVTRSRTCASIKFFTYYSEMISRSHWWPPHILK